MLRLNQLPPKCSKVDTQLCFQVLSLRMKSITVTIQMKAIEQCFPVVLFIMLPKVVLTIESVDEIQKCDHGNESY